MNVELAKGEQVLVRLRRIERSSFRNVTNYLKYIIIPG